MIKIPDWLDAWLWKRKKHYCNKCGELLTQGNCRSLYLRPIQWSIRCNDCLNKSQAEENERFIKENTNVVKRLE